MEGFTVRPQVKTYSSAESRGVPSAVKMCAESSSNPMEGGNADKSEWMVRVLMTRADGSVESRERLRASAKELLTDSMAPSRDKRLMASATAVVSEEVTEEYLGLAFKAGTGEVV
jgi:hypothetical protein